MTEFTNEVQLEDIAVRDTNVSDAVDEPFRAMILDILASEDRTVTQIHDALSKRGFDRTKNTIRHHVNELREAGLVEVARLEERRGATTKYYRATTIVLSYSLPDGADEMIDAMVDSVELDVGELVSRVRSEHREELDQIASEMTPCQHCQTQKYDLYILSTVLQRAFVRAHARDLLS